jgi:PAS domain S-box-containing protein
LKKILGCGVVGIGLLGILGGSRAWLFLFSSGYLPHSFCYLAQPGLIWTNAAMDGLIAFSYVAIFGWLFWMVGRLRTSPELQSYLWILICFGTFILACAGTHLMEVITLWWPVYWASVAVKIACAAASVITAMLLSQSAPAAVGRIQQFLETAALNRKEQLIDITLRKQAEDMRERLAAIVDSSDDAIISCDLEGNIVAWNRGSAKLSGYSVEEALGKPLSLLFAPPERREEDARVFERVAHGESFEHLETVRVRKDGRRIYVSATVSPIRDSNGKIVGISRISRDISERKEAESRLAAQGLELAASHQALEEQTLMVRKLNEELELKIAERTSQLEAANRELEAFTYSVSHDLRAPLRHVSGFSKILQADHGSTMAAEAQELLERIEEAIVRMGKLIDGLLSLARLGRQSLHVRENEINAIVTQVISVLQPECEGRQVEWRIAPLPKLPCDAVLIGQVFQNLLGNALKYSRQRSHTVIEIDSIQREGEPAAIFVRDNGAGFNMKYAGKLFGVFQRMHSEDEFQGTGVGLATVQRIIQKHGGTVWAEAEVGRGATFYFSVGRIEAPALPQNVAAAE